MCEAFWKLYPNLITGNQKHLFKLRWPIQEKQHEQFTFGLNML